MKLMQALPALALVLAGLTVLPESGEAKGWRRRCRRAWSGCGCAQKVVASPCATGCGASYAAYGAYSGYGNYGYNSYSAYPAGYGYGGYTQASYSAPYAGGVVDPLNWPYYAGMQQTTAADATATEAQENAAVMNDLQQAAQ